MEIIIKAAQLIVSLSILVIIHELGHFTFARLFKTRVEKFYLFFNPWFSLFKKKINDTEWGVGWLPLGGFVKISGMIDESMDREQMKKPPQPWEFRSKTAGQRFFIMFGGVLFNFILAILIFIGLLWANGETYLPNKNLTDGIWVRTEVGEKLGLKSGDKIISINGEKPEKFTNIIEEIAYGGDILLTRNGKDTTIHIDKDKQAMLLDKENMRGFIYPRIPFVVGKVLDSSININSGLQPKDVVIGINDHRLKYFDEFGQYADKYKGQEVILTVKRDSVTMPLQVKISDSSKIGVQLAGFGFEDLQKHGIYKFETINYSFLESIPKGIVTAKEELFRYVRQFKLVLNPSTGAYKQMGGFLSIGDLFPGHIWDWEYFWNMTALLSVMLAFMNVLPIPALDGGHIIFLLYEIVTRRKPGDKFMERAQLIGMSILLTLLLFVNGNDIVKFFF